MMRSESVDLPGQEQPSGAHRADGGEHTPGWTRGPWRKRAASIYIPASPQSGDWQVYCGTPENANLLFAAPALYDALEAMAGYVALWMTDHAEGLKPTAESLNAAAAEIQAALALASGEPSQ